MFALKTEFVTNGGSFSWSFIISGTLKEWSSFYLLTVNFVFASITWGTFYFSFYGHFLIVFTLSSMTVFRLQDLKGFFVLLYDDSGLLEKDLIGHLSVSCSSV